MHAAKLDRSKRLQRIMKVLSDHKPHSSMELIRRAKTVAIGTDISEIRRNKRNVKCKREGKIWFYRLVS